MEDTLQSVGFMNFGTVDLGDNRRTERLVALVDIMCRHPGGTLPDKLNRPADLRAFYRLMNRPEVTHTILIGGHAAATRERIAALPPGSVVLNLHDATELDFTSSARECGAQPARCHGTGFHQQDHTPGSTRSNRPRNAPRLYLPQQSGGARRHWRDAGAGVANIASSC